MTSWTSFNRTLWNWNAWIMHIIINNRVLLIEPYGIETELEQLERLYNQSFNRTLWNWNGFDPNWKPDTEITFNRTLWNWNCISTMAACCPSLLLIEPYGIETLKLLMVCRLCRLLLIEPYGIETSSIFPSFPFVSLPFNRTLWNWNLAHLLREMLPILLLIEPYGIETTHWHVVIDPFGNF